MTVGVPKEIKEQEFRVPLLPSAVYQLVKRGHHVLVEADAGSGIGFGDADYRAAGAKVVPEHDEAFFGADMIVKVKEPTRIGMRSAARGPDPLYLSSSGREQSAHEVSHRDGRNVHRLRDGRGDTGACRFLNR